MKPKTLLKKHFPHFVNFIIQTTKFFSLFHRQVYTIFYYLFLNKKGIQPNSNKRIIITLTTIPSRIKSVQIVIARLFNQSLKPNKIILYLGKDEFKNMKFPKLLQKEIKNGLIVKYCEDIKPHKKYFFTMKSFPNDIIITVDDDFWYSKKLIEKLYNSYLKHPKAVSCMHCTQMQKDKNSNFLPYTKWTIAKETNTERFDYFPIGVGGVLYPPNSLNKEVFNIENIKKMCLFADDIWLKAMELLNKTPVVLVEMIKKFKYIPASQEVALWKTNLNESKNDKQLNDVFNFYNNFLGEKENLFKMIFYKK